jgi:succinate-semialdehyde dehydrogenase/glutarate-semialdehyde dehydrogenase
MKEVAIVKTSLKAEKNAKASLKKDLKKDSDKKTGKDSPKSAGTTECTNPYTTKVLKTYKYETLESAQKTVEKSHKAYQAWSKESLNNRIKILTKFSGELKKYKDALAEQMTSEMGKRLEESKKEIDLCIAISNYSCKNAKEFLKDEEVPLKEGRALISYQPTGVVLSIQPWNFPLYQVVRNMIPNLLGGNTMVLKHASTVWGTAKMISDMCKNIGLPENVFKLIHTSGEDSSNLIEHKYVRSVCFTGSEGTGRKVGERAGRELKKSILELGGSDPYIVLADADVDYAADVCFKGRIANNGQVCTGAKRFIVVADVYDEFKEKFVAKMKSVKMGDPMNNETQLGPMVRKDLRDELAKQVKDSIKKGAVCLTGGKIPDLKGWFYEATVLENVKPGMPAYDEEFFGPVASLIKVKDKAEAIKVANDTKFGLGGGIFSKDVKAAVEMAKTEIESGMININGFINARPHLPFGGVKNSGFGREQGEIGFKEFLNVKVVKITDK